MVVSPDEGGAKRSVSIANDLGLEFAMIHNRLKTSATGGRWVLLGIYYNQRTLFPKSLCIIFSCKTRCILFHAGPPGAHVKPVLSQNPANWISLQLLMVRMKSVHAF